MYLNSNRIPSVIKDEHKCSHCELVQTCVLYHKAVEGGEASAEHTGLVSLFPQHSKHLTQEHIQYFKLWERLIDLEKNETQQLKKEIWSMTSKEREQVGRCFSRMRRVKAEQRDSGHVYTFVLAERQGFGFSPNYYLIELIDLIVDH